MKTCQPSFHKGQVNLLITEHYRSPIDFAFLPDGNYFVCFCKYGNGRAGAIEVYSLWDGDRRTTTLAGLAMWLKQYCNVF